MIIRKMQKKQRIKASDIAEAIERFAPLATQAEWDNSGFTVGNPNAEVHKALIALNCSLEVVKEAVANGCDMIITHHPLIVHKPCLSILEGDVRSDTIMLAIRSGITVYSSHTPLDRAKGGLNDIMAAKMGLKDCTPLSDGFGVVGKISPVGADALIAKVKKAFGVSNVRTSSPLKGKIFRVAVSSGGGQGSISEAIAMGAQVLLTGDVTHHNFYCPAGFMVVDLGHHFSELPAIGLLESIVKKNFPTFALHLSEADLSPIFYF